MKKNMNELYMKLITETFKDVFDKYSFSFLKMEVSVWGSYYYYVNTTTGLKIAFEWEFLNISVEIFSLENGRFIDNPPFQRAQYSARLENIVMAKDPTFKYIIEQSEDLLKSDQAIKRRLTYLLELINNYATECLLGNFSIFQAVGRLIEARNRDNRK